MCPSKFSFGQDPVEQRRQRPTDQGTERPAAQDDPCEPGHRLDDEEEVEHEIDRLRAGPRSEVAQTADQLDAGADDYLVKPLQMQVFQVRLQAAENTIREKLRRRLIELKLRESEEMYRMLVHALPETGGGRRGNGNPTFLFLLHEVHGSGTVVYFTDLVT